MLGAAWAGFALGGSLIIAIGAQNAFVIRQGVLNQYVFWVCLFCASSDAGLIWAGTYGLAAVLAVAPQLQAVLRYGGVIFLLWYGIKAALRALHAQAMEDSTEKPQSLGAAITLCAAFTWLNPHVYLDTVVLVGSIANARPAGERLPFAIGTVTGHAGFGFSRCVVCGKCRAGRIKRKRGGNHCRRALVTEAHFLA